MENRDAVHLANDVINSFIKKCVDTEKKSTHKKFAPGVFIAILTLLSASCFFVSAAYLLMWFLS